MTGGMATATAHRSGTEGVPSLVTLLWETSRRDFVSSALAGSLAGASFAGVLFFINRAITEAGLPNGRSLAVLVTCVAAAAGSTAICQLLMSRMQERALFELRLRLVDRILATPLRDLEEVGAHRLQVLLCDDLAAISESLMLLPRVFVSGMTLVAGFLYLGILSPLLSVALAGFVGLAVFSWAVPARVGTRFLRRARDLQNNVYRQFHALVTGIKQLKLDAVRRELFREDLRTAARDYRVNAFIGSSTFGAAVAWGQFLFLGMIVVLLWLLPRTQGLSVETVVAFVVAMLFLRGPIELILSFLPPVVRGNVALAKVAQIGLGRASDVPSPTPPRTAPTWSELRLESVTHRYAGPRSEQFRLGPVTLSVRPGEVVFITGGNGSGKTTLVKLLTGLYRPESGRITIDGALVSDDRAESYRQMFAAVFFDFCVFERLRSADAADRAKHLLAALHLREIVDLRDGALSTTDLSQGQRRRLALLDALLSDRSIFVLDEWAADQDPKFKQIFYEEILPSLKRQQKGVVVITHDDRYFSVADRIVHLEMGQIVGTSAPPRAEAVV